MKKAALAIIMLLVVIAVGVALYFLFFREVVGPAGPSGGGPSVEVPGGGGLEPSGPGVVEPTVPSGGGPEVQAPQEVANGGVTIVRPVSPAPTTGATVGRGGQVSYYDRNDGRFYRMTSDGTVKKLSDKQFFNVSNAEFSDSGNVALVEYPDGSNITYNFVTDQQTTLPSHWEDFAFTSGSETLVAKSISLNEASNYLVMANADGSGARPVRELGAGAAATIVDPSPSSQVIALYPTNKGQGLGSQEVYFLGQHGENFKSMIVEGLDFRPKWTPDGERLLYSVAGQTSDYEPLLWIVDAAGDDIGRNRRILNVNTWADKCTFADNSTVYCAVPNSLPRGAGLQPNIADTTPDNIMKIDVDTGLQTLVAVPEGTYTVDRLMISPDGRNLYFTDRNTGILSNVKLAP